MENLNCENSTVMFLSGFAWLFLSQFSNVSPTMALRTYARRWTRFTRSYGRRRFTRSYGVALSRPLRTRRTFTRRRRSAVLKWYYGLLPATQNTPAQRLRLPRYGYLKVINMSTGREFFVKEERAPAYPPPAFSITGYSAEAFANSSTVRPPLSVADRPN